MSWRKRVGGKNPWQASDDPWRSTTASSGDEHTGAHYVPSSAALIFEQMVCRIGKAFRLANTDLYRLECHEYDAEVAEVAQLLRGCGKRWKPHLSKSKDADTLLDLLAMLALPPSAAAAAAAEAERVRALEEEAFAATAAEAERSRAVEEALATTEAAEAELFRVIGEEALAAAAIEAEGFRVDEEALAATEAAEAERFRLVEEAHAATAAEAERFRLEEEASAATAAEAERFRAVEEALAATDRGIMLRKEEAAARYAKCPSGTGHTMIKGAYGKRYHNDKNCYEGWCDICKVNTWAVDFATCKKCEHAICSRCLSRMPKLNATLS